MARLQLAAAVLPPAVDTSKDFEYFPVLNIEYIYSRGVAMPIARSISARRCEPPKLLLSPNVASKEISNKLAKAQFVVKRRLAPKWITRCLSPQRGTFACFFEKNTELRNLEITAANPAF